MKLVDYLMKNGWRQVDDETWAHGHKVLKLGPKEAAIKIRRKLTSLGIPGNVELPGQAPLAPPPAPKPELPKPQPPAPKPEPQLPVEKVITIEAELPTPPAKDPAKKITFARQAAIMVETARKAKVEKVEATEVTEEKAATKATEEKVPEEKAVRKKAKGKKKITMKKASTTV